MCSEECTDLYIGETKQLLTKRMSRHRRANSTGQDSGQDSAVFLHLKDEGHLFEDSKGKQPVQPKESGYLKSVVLKVTQIWPLKYVFKLLNKILSLAGLSPKIENVGTVESKSPYGRRFVIGRKRLGCFARLLLSLAPQRLQCALGYHSADSIGQSAGTDDIRKSPLKPCGKGSKRKQDDLEVEEQQSWVALMNEDLPDEDDEDDPTYEPSNTDTDSEEHHSKNDTESDLEIEEKEGVVMLKESPAKKPETMVNGDPSNKEEKSVPENQTDEHQNHNSSAE